jgi:CheY-like chemotaxis protein/predicted regulator of Ras-like GTPase activity (Roadblock/LC7/MglB family)
MPETKRILIVDDDKSVRMLMHSGLKRVDTNWEIETASSGEEALTQIQDTPSPFDLVITDLRMPGMQGLELIEKLRGISPNTKVILLTAYGSDDVEQEAEKLEVQTYLSKPVPIPTIRKIVKDVLERTTKERMEKPLQPISEEEEDEILERVTLLGEQTGARCILLISSAGHLIAQAGTIQGIDVNALAALVAANVAAMAEIARLLESKAAFKSFFQEGEEFNIYSHIVDQESILIVVASPEVKTGLIWFYARRAADELQETLKDMPELSMDELDIAAVSASLDQAFLDEGFEEVFPPEESTVAKAEEPAATAKAPSTPPQPEESEVQESPQLLSMEDAIAQGLIPKELLE